MNGERARTSERKARAASRPGCRGRLCHPDGAALASDTITALCRRALAATPARRLANARADRCSDGNTRWRANTQRQGSSMRARTHHACVRPSRRTLRLAPPLLHPLFVPKNTEQQMPTDNTEDGILMSDMLTKLSRSVPHSTTKCPTA